MLIGISNVKPILPQQSNILKWEPRTDLCEDHFQTTGQNNYKDSAIGPQIVHAKLMWFYFMYLNAPLIQISLFFFSLEHLFNHLTVCK